MRSRVGRIDEMREETSRSLFPSRLYRIFTSFLDGLHTTGFVGFSDGSLVVLA